MKTIQKIFLLFILAGGIVISSSFHTVAQDITTGVFNTYRDYLQHHLTVYSKITLGHNSFKGVLNGNKIYSQYRDADFWGAEDANGIMYRVNKTVNTADRIISSGSVFYYAGMELKIQRSGDVATKTTLAFDIKATKGVKFSDIFWVSEGADGNMVGATVENVSKLLADSPDLVAKVHDMDETNTDKWVDTYIGIATLIGEYDKAHK